MKPISLPHRDVVPLRDVAPGVAGLRIAFVNVFAISNAAGWSLVDAGLYGTAPRILRWTRRLFGATRPNAIFLTHAHFDHIGALEELARTWDVPVYAHPYELDYLVGGKAYPPPDPAVGGGLMARMSFLYPRRAHEFTGAARPLPHDGTLPHHDGWQSVPTPGHSPGHVSFFREADRTLVAGDALCTTRQESVIAVATQRPELQGPPAYFTPDWDAARDSVRRLTALDPAILAPSHGRAMSGEATSKALRELSSRFDELARPRHGRYVSRPAPTPAPSRPLP
jgi:glyoxylase-like metal-dependent hydrolase (beta-lactamase superfamily II)